MLQGRSILLVIGGGIAAYKSLELIRRLRDKGATVRCVLTEAGRKFVTPLSVASLSGNPVEEDLFDPDSEAAFGHIRLSREADLIVVAPATANLIARMASGLGSDLATTLLLATDAPVLVAPAMNVRMWEHPATRRNIATLCSDGIEIVGPDEGEMACGEYGPGRMSEPDTVLKAVLNRLAAKGGLAGRKAVVTAGPTHEALDPVRYIGNRSSGKQGLAVAHELVRAGATVTLVAGPGVEEEIDGCVVHHVTGAEEMRKAVLDALPADVFVGLAAVADWRPETVAEGKMKKSDGPPEIRLVANPDILAEVAGLTEGRRPALVVGFAAETGDPAEAAASKLKSKGCDWIVGNDVSAGVFGGEENEVVLVTVESAESWPRMSKRKVAAKLVERIERALL